MALAFLCLPFLLQCSPRKQSEADRDDAKATGDRFMEFVEVGNAGNPDDSGGLGGVAYSFEIGKYPVTNRQYCEFLNAVAAADPHGLFDLQMGREPHGGIKRNGAAGGYTYEPKSGWENKPVTFVNWFDAARFCNWMHHGKPSGPAGASTTEAGAYSLSATSGIELPGSDSENGANGRNDGARYFLPSEDEWYKAAYYQPADQGGDADGYWLFPIRGNDPPVAEPPPGGGRSANFDSVLESLTEVGAYKDGAGPYGAFDMAGNTWEWTEQIFKGGLRGVRGGSWLNGSAELRATARATSGSGFGLGNNGFRVARRASN